MDDVDEALAMGEPLLAQVLLDERYAAARRSGEGLLPLARRRAALAWQLAVDDDPGSLASTVKRHLDVLASPGAGPDDVRAAARAELLAGKLRAAVRRDPGLAPLVAALGSEATLRAVDADPELSVRLGHQRCWPMVEAADALPEGAAFGPGHLHVRGLREVARHLAGRVEEARADRAAFLVRAERELPPGDPRWGAVERVRAGAAPPAEALALRLVALARVEGRFGPARTEPALWALQHDASRAGAREVARDALARLADLLRKKSRRLDRRTVLTDLAKVCGALGRFEEAEAAADEVDRLHLALGFEAPDHGLRARLAFDRGDLQGWLAHHETWLRRCEAGLPPVFGPTGSTTSVVRAWTEQARAKVASSAARG